MNADVCVVEGETEKKRWMSMERLFKDLRRCKSELRQAGQLAGTQCPCSFLPCLFPRFCQLLLQEGAAFDQIVNGNIAAARCASCGRGGRARANAVKGSKSTGVVLGAAGFSGALWGLGPVWPMATPCRALPPHPVWPTLVAAHTLCKMRFVDNMARQRTSTKARRNRQVVRRLIKRS